MARKVGALSVIGLCVLIISIIVYFSWFTHPYSSQDLIIGITGMLLGFISVIIDYLLAKNKDTENEIHSRLDIFGKIVGVGIIAWFADLIFFSTAIGGYALLLGELVCFVIIIPVIIIGLALFLILVRTPLSKKLTRRNVIIVYVILAVIILIFPTYFIWPSISPTYQGSLHVNQLSFSKNNERVFVRAEGSNIMTAAPYPGFLTMYQVWDLSSGTLVWNITNPHNIEMALSPNGDLINNENNRTIYSLGTGTYLMIYDGDSLGWMMNDSRFITANETQLHVWDAVNKTILNTIAYPSAGQMIPSYDGSKIVIVPKGHEATMLSVIDVASEGASKNTWYHFNTSIYRMSMKISWSSDGTKLQLAYPMPGTMNDHNYSWYRVLVWDVTTTLLIQNTSFSYYYGEHGNNGLLQTWFGEYAIRDDDHDQIIIYNIATGETEHIFRFDKNLGAAALSPDKNLIAAVSDGIIEVKNTSTGITVQRLILPFYEMKRIIPGFESVFVFCAVALFVILRYKRRKK